MNTNYFYNKLKSLLESLDVVVDIDLNIISENIEFDFLEYTSFINQNYKPWAGNWVRKEDDKIIYNSSEILEEFIKTLN